MRIYILICVLISIARFSDAQNTTITSKIIDAQTQEPLVGVNVLIEQTGEGTITNWNGEFTITANTINTKILLSYIGYESQTFVASDCPNIIQLSPTIAELSKVIISASRDQQNRSDAPIAISTLTSSIIEESRQTSIDQLVNKIPGVFMVDLGNEQHSMSIRQPLSYKSLFLYLEDGLPIRPTGVFNHNALLEMNQASFRSIEVIKGPSSSLYGSEAIGGAINFITIRPTALPSTTLRLQMNNLGYKRADLNASNTFGKLGVALSGYYANQRKGFREHSDLDKLALTLKLTYKASDKDFLEADATFVDYRSDMTGSLDSLAFFSKEYTSFHTFTNRKVQAFRSKISYKRFWNEQSKTTITAFFRDNSIKQIPSYRIRDDYSPWGNPTGNRNLAHGESNNNSYKSLGGLVQHRQQLNFWNSSVIAGAYIDYSPNTYKANYISITKNNTGIYTDYINEADSMLTDYEVGLLNWAGYAQIETSPFKNFKLVAAIRYDAFTYDYKNNLSENAFSGAPDNVDRFWAITPKIGMTYTIAKKSGVYANFSQGFVPPQISELYRGTKVPSLKSATYNNYEVGTWINLFKDKIHADLSLYWMDGFNEIISVRQDNGIYKNENAGKTNHIGIEYGLNYKPIKDLMIRLSGTNAQHKFVDYIERGNDYSGNLMNGSPAWIANAEITYKPNFFKGFRIAVEMQHMSPYYMDAANTKKHRGFTIFNLRTGYTIKGFELWCNLMNFTNQLYATNASSSLWGESYTVGNPININVGLGYKFIGKPKS